MIPSSLKLNSDDFPFFGNLKREKREKLEKSSFENRDNHHQSPLSAALHHTADLSNVPNLLQIIK